MTSIDANSLCPGYEKNLDKGRACPWKDTADPSNLPNKLFTSYLSPELHFAHTFQTYTHTTRSHAAKCLCVPGMCCPKITMTLKSTLPTTKRLDKL